MLMQCESRVHKDNKFYTPCKMHNEKANNYCRDCRCFLCCFCVCDHTKIVDKIIRDSEIISCYKESLHAEENRAIYSAASIVEGVIEPIKDQITSYLANLKNIIDSYKTIHKIPEHMQTLINEIKNGNDPNVKQKFNEEPNNKSQTLMSHIADLSNLLKECNKCNQNCNLNVSMKESEDIYKAIKELSSYNTKSIVQLPNASEALSHASSNKRTSISEINAHAVKKKMLEAPHHAATKMPYITNQQSLIRTTAKEAKVVKEVKEIKDANKNKHIGRLSNVDLSNIILTTKNNNLHNLSI